MWNWDFSMCKSQKQPMFRKVEKIKPKHLPCFVNLL